jgi:hypothetical protein
MRIRVTAAHRYRSRRIERSEGFDKFDTCYICPVAIALYQATGATWSVGITIADIPNSRRRKGRICVALPIHVDTWIRSWHQGIDPGDVSFDINYEIGNKVPLTPWSEHFGEEIDESQSV